MNKDFPEYHIISEFYKGKTAKRSGVPYMNHIDEGLIILEQIGASWDAHKAFCLHPIFQADMDLGEFVYKNIPIHYDMLNGMTVLLCMEYRSVANEYLSKRIITDISEIRLSPLKEVNDMLIADKVQNFKDFILYHRDHERYNELYAYFNNWFNRLGVNNEGYSRLVKNLIIK